jgi:hypothetical protein
MRQIKLKRHLTAEQDEALRSPIPQKAKPEDFDPGNLVNPYEDVEAFKEDDSLLFRVVANAFEMQDVARAYEHLKKGLCTTISREPHFRLLSLER